MAGLIDCKSEEDYDQLCDLLIGKYLVTGYQVVANCFQQTESQMCKPGQSTKSN